MDTDDGLAARLAERIGLALAMMPAAARERSLKTLRKGGRLTVHRSESGWITVCLAGERIAAFDLRDLAIQ